MQLAKASISAAGQSGPKAGPAQVLLDTPLPAKPVAAATSAGPAQIVLDKLQIVPEDYLDKTPKVVIVDPTGINFLSQGKRPSEAGGLPGELYKTFCVSKFNDRAIMSARAITSPLGLDATYEQAFSATANGPGKKRNLPTVAF